MMRFHYGISRVLPVIVGALAVVLALTDPILAQPSAPKETHGEAKPIQGQLLCPTGEGSSKTPCRVTIDCPPIQPGGKTICDLTIECPPVKKKEK